ncbi:unnamed protein product [Heligmosomoides polygyrus]|uniref:WSC domain-containing protein n=1 Tax=Heligmosomoides polygyrus TaxID=6339 RepID=A0A183G5D1_HELPZ|nr:unnamed protein product [Heligmosomoides polygyrus]
MAEATALIGFVASDSSGSSYGFSVEDPLYEKAIAECCIIKESPSFCEGILLKCVDNQPMFPYMHFSQFQSCDCQQRQREMDDVVKECRVFPGSLFGRNSNATFRCDVAALKRGRAPGGTWFAAEHEILLVFKLLNWKRNDERV